MNTVIALITLLDNISSNGLLIQLGMICYIIKKVSEKK